MYDEPAEFLAWFAEYLGTDDAKAKAHRVARRCGVADLAGDLLSEWTVAVFRTMRNKEARGALSGAFGSEDDARAYAYRALESAARRLLEPQAEHDDPIDRPDPRPGPGDTLPVDEVRERILALAASSPSGRYGCTGHRCTAVAVVIVEIAVGDRPLTQDDVDQVGGSDEWQRLVDRGFRILWPELFGDGPHRLSARVRQMKSRCGKCAHELLREIFLDMGYGDIGEADG